MISRTIMRGLDLVDEMRGSAPARKLENIDELYAVTSAAYCHFRSMYLQIAFVRTRNWESKEENDALVSLVNEERELAKTLHTIVATDSRIGFEASNHYYYTLNDLKEKVLNCEYVRRKLLNES